MRIPKTIAIIALSVIFTAISLVALSEQLTGRQIMDREEKQNKGNDEYNKMSMKLINDRGQERNRKVEYFRKTDKSDNDKILMRFLEPADVKGVGLLTVEYSERDDDQWLYLPALRKVRRITSSDQGDNFMGTDFTYEDIRSEKLDQHQYSVARSEVIEGHDCYVIEAVPSTEKQKKESSYSRREIWVRKDIFLTVQTKYYDKKGEYFKVEIRKDIAEVTPNIYRPNLMEMKNLKSGHTTRLGFDERKINKGLNDNIFSERELQKG